MRVEVRKENKVRIFKIYGEVVGDIAISLRRRLNALLAEISDDEKPLVVLNLTKVSMMDCAGLGVLVSTYTSINKKGGRLVLAELGKGLQNLVSITKLTRVFDIYETEVEAIRDLSTLSSTVTV